MKDRREKSKEKEADYCINEDECCFMHTWTQRQIEKTTETFGQVVKYDPIGEHALEHPQEQ